MLWTNLLNILFDYMIYFLLNVSTDQNRQGYSALCVSNRNDILRVARF